jgi:hypothetical protein
MLGVLKLLEATMLSGGAGPAGAGMARSALLTRLAGLLGSLHACCTCVHPLEPAGKGTGWHSRQLLLPAASLSGRNSERL